MKKIGFLMVAVGVLSACNNKATLENKADSLAKKVDSFSKNVWDSAKKEADKLEEKVRDKFDKKDSAKK